MARARSSARRRTALSGEIDVATAPLVQAELLGVALESLSTVLILDCSQLTFIDSSGLNMLVQLGRLTEKRIELVNLGPGPRQVFEIAGLCDLFGIRPAAEQAPKS
jgi:anti-anti-sigma factor